MVSSGVLNPVVSTTTFDGEEGVSCCPAAVATTVDIVAVNAIGCSFLSTGKGGLNATLSSRSQRKAPRQTGQD